jgi:hypothetical protein
MAYATLKRSLFKRFLQANDQERTGSGLGLQKFISKTIVYRLDECRNQVSPVQLWTAPVKAQDCKTGNRRVIATEWQIELIQNLLALDAPGESEYQIQIPQL